MSFTETDFRNNFPEFANTSAYPSAQFTFWNGIAANRLSEARWGDLYDFGAQLFIAHNLVLARRGALAAGTGNTPGSTQGVISAKAVDKVSVSYDAGSVTAEGAANWNATDYGVRYWELAMMVGAGGAQLA